LRNFPKPKKAEMDNGSIVMYYKGENQIEPPVYTKESGDKVIYFREDNDKLCGFDIKNWSKHNNIDLIEWGERDNSLEIDAPRY